MQRLFKREALTIGLASSLLGHVLVAHAIPQAIPSVVEPEPHFVELVPPPPLPVPPPPPDEIEAPVTAPDTVSEMAPTVVKQPTPAPPSQPAAAPPATNAAPLALAGVTLGGDDGSWSSAMGNGERIVRPITTARPAPAAKPRQQRRASAPSPRPAPPPADVALKDLAQKPSAPNLNGALRRFYPAAAREQQVSGSAAVRARIGPGGTVTTTQLVSESFAGFGAACQSALRGSSWSPPRDHAGRAVSTWILYRCTFQLN